MSGRKWRLLKVGAVRYRWGIGHRHERRGDDGLFVGCRDVLVLMPDGSRDRVDIEFPAVDGHQVRDGLRHAGSIKHAGHATSLNLHEPGVVRAFLDEVVATGWPPGQVTVDGWALFEAVLRRRGH